MSLELPKRARRVAVAVAGISALVLLSGCSTEDKDALKRLAMPVPASEEAPHTLHLWQWGWVAALITGVIVWGLIFYVSFRYRRRSEDEVPVQTRYHLPIEIFYTIAPVMMVVTFFFFTVKAQNEVLPEFDNPDRVITVVGEQWSWTFNYNLDYDDKGRTFIPSGDGEVVHEGGTTADRPTLWMVKGEHTEIHLYSPDVIHSFWVPEFLIKLDVVPGRDNQIGVTPTRLGTFTGRCAELCGVYHSRMLFNLKIVTRAEFDAHMQKLAAAGQTGPALGGTAVTETPGLTNENETDGGEQ